MFKENVDPSALDVPRRMAPPPPRFDDRARDDNAGTVAVGGTVARVGGAPTRANDGVADFAKFVAMAWCTKETHMR